MADHKKIAKNTMFLFLRMLLQLVISLYTSRVVLEALGIEDYGVFSIVAGVLSVISYVNQALSSSTLRFITFSLEHDPFPERKRVFNTGINIHFFLCIIIIILAETVGLWFFYNKLNLQPGSEHSAFILYQISIGSTVLAILTLPFSSLIIAHEKMSIFAYFSIIDTILKLGIVYILLAVNSGRLILYGWLMLGTQIVYTSIYFYYCYKKCPESHLNFKIQKSVAKQMLSFAGWSMFGCTAAIGYTQGLNLLLNIFGGTVVNAARGLAVQIQGVIVNFVANFQTAVNPQIIKTYAGNRLDEMHNLIYLSSKFSFYLVFLMVTPLYANMEIVLKFWLGELPQYLTIFLKIILLITLLDTLSNPLMKSADATGKIKIYHIIVGCTLMGIPLVAYFVLKNDAPLYSVFIIQLLFGIVALFERVAIIKNMISLNIAEYIRIVLLPIIIIAVIFYFFNLFVESIKIENGFLHFIVTSSIITLFNLGSIWMIGLNNHERFSIKSKIQSFYLRLANN